MDVTIQKQITFMFTVTLYSLPSSELVSSVANTINPHLNLNALIDDFFNV